MINTVDKLIDKKAMAVFAFIILLGILIISIPFSFINEPKPINSSTAGSIKLCTDKGWVPIYFSDSSNVLFICTPIEDVKIDSNFLTNKQSRSE